MAEENSTPGIQPLDALLFSKHDISLSGFLPRRGGKDCDSLLIFRDGDLLDGSLQ